MDAPVYEPPRQENRTWPIVGTIAAILLCGLPGLCLLCPLSIWAFTGKMPDFTSSYGGYFTSTWGILPLCLSVLFIAIGVVVPILLLRKKKPAVAAVEVPPPPMPPQEPLPPAS